MDTHTQKFKVRLGLFVVGGLALFMMAIFIIGKQKNLFNPVFKLTTNFYNVSGLQVGNNIRFSGINVGTVDVISIINDSTVRVDMLVRKEVQQFIKSDSKVAIGSEGLIGDRLLIITQGTTDAPLAKDGQHLDSTEPVETDAIIASLQVTAGSVEVITKELAEVMTNVNSGKGTLGRLIQDSTIAEDINQTIQNFKESSSRLNETMEASRQNLTDILASLRVTADNSEGITKQVERSVIEINEGKGTLGRLIYDTIIAGNINSTIYNLNKTTEGLNSTIEAFQHSLLLKGMFKKKAAADELKMIEAAEQEAAEQKEQDQPK
ncbi:MAG: MCE family protein [Lentimicrobium sp.]|nr:MCE family protein [Lentimicrobium sp.]